MLGDGFGETRGDKVKRLVPACTVSADLRMKNTSVEIDGFGERRALGTQASEIGGMVRSPLTLTVPVSSILAMTPQPTPQ